MLRRSDFIDARYAFSFVLANFGIAIAARMPMITTTIKSSISVKPLRLLRIKKSPGVQLSSSRRCPTPVCPRPLQRQRADQHASEHGTSCHSCTYQLRAVSGPERDSECFAWFLALCHSVSRPVWYRRRPLHSPARRRARTGQTPNGGAGSRGEHVEPEDVPEGGEAVLP